MHAADEVRPPTGEVQRQASWLTSARCAQNSGAPPDVQLRAVGGYFCYRKQLEYYRAFMFLHNEGLRDPISPDVIKEIHHRAGMNFRLAAEIVQAGADAGMYRPDLDTGAWWMCCGRC